MKRVSIRTAILLPSLAVLIACIAVMATFAGILSSNADKELTTQLIEARVNEYTNEFGELCGEVYAVVSATTPIIANYIDPEFAVDVSNPRGEVTNILSNVLMSDDNIMGMWTAWEPNAFDGNDDVYANTSFYDETGRFVPYVYRNGSGFGVEALADYDDPVAGIYYQGALNSGKPYITDPYPYSVGGESTLMCSIAIPVLQNDKVAGVVGVDIDLKYFIELMNEADIHGDGYVYVLSPGGFFATHPQESLIMEHYDTTWMSAYRDQTNEALANGGKFNINAYSDVVDDNVSFLGTGIMIGDTGRYWLVCGVVPEKSINASSVTLLQMIILVGFFVILVVGFTIFLVVRSRLRELPKLKLAAEAIADGNIDSKNLDAGTGATRNEIAQLSRAFYKMTTGIKAQAEVLHEISQGDYSMSVSERSENDEINQAINKMLDNTNKTLNHINSAAGQVSAGSKQIAEGAQLLAQGGTQQASAIEQLSASIRDISDKTSQNAAIAKEAASLSTEIKGNAEKGNRQMDQMMNAVSEINEASSQIGKVIKVIDDIAFQTNILALNAAIEASKAGLAGKGFAVVAEEVRSLAAKSTDAAKDTSGMIENSIAKANHGLTIAAETSKSLKEIVDGINRSAEIVEQIARSSDEQNAAISQIDSGIAQVSQVIQLNSATSQESAAASAEMSEQADMLKQLTAQFHLK